MDCQIRIANSNDASLIVTLGRTAFSESFGKFNTPQDLAAHLESTYTLEIVKSEMEAGCTYLIAEADGEAAGFAKLRSNQTAETPDCIPGESPLEIHQIYLLAKHHRKGIGRKLVDEATALARSNNHDGLFLGVWEKGEWAIKFYEAIGMTKVGSHIFRVGSDDQTDYLMYLAIGN